MKRLLFAAFGLAVTGLAIVTVTTRGHAQAQPGKDAPVDYGPGPGGAALRPPGSQAVPAISEPAYNPAYSNPMPPQTMPVGGNNNNGYNPASMPWAGLVGNAAIVKGGPPSAPPPRNLFDIQEPPDINQDIRVTSDLGEFMICLITYYGEQAPQRARNMVLELRTKHNIPNVFVFNHGAEERRKERERVKEYIQQKREIFRRNGVPENVQIPIHYPRLANVEDQCGVLIGGYKDDTAAQRALDAIRSRKIILDPKKVDLDTKVVGRTDEKSQLLDTYRGYVNPFERAFVGRNPAAKAERLENKFNLAGLENLNREEPFSLLKCPKPVTLVYKQIVTAQVVPAQQTKAEKSSFLGSMLHMGHKEDHVDGSATIAHVLAEKLRSMRVDAYVLHTKYSSIVTVGAFDRMDDPALLTMQEFFQKQVHLEHVNPYPVPIPWEFWNSISKS